MYVKGRRDPQPLIDPAHYSDAVAIQHHLFEELIPAAVRSRPPPLADQTRSRPQRRHDPDQIRRWLTTLAIELRDAQTRDWRWWQLARHTFTTRQYDLAGGLVFGLPVGVMTGVLVGEGVDRF